MTGGGSGLTGAQSRLPAFGVLAVLIVLIACVPFSLEDFDWVPVIALGAWLMTTAVVGALVLSARPGNPVGPLMLGAAFAVTVTALFFPSYATYAFESGHPELPLRGLVAWLTLWTTIPSFSLFIHLLLRFPTGALPSPWWRWASRLTTAAVVCTAFGYALRSGPIDAVRTLSNPLGAVAPAWVSRIGIVVGDILLPLTGLLAVASLFVRYKRAQVAERQQMKWFIFAVSLFPVLFLVSQLVQFADDSEEEYLGFLLIVAALLFVPVSMGIGILKHRLYDIDVVLNRALVYAVLTGILGVTYLGIVVLLQGVLGPITKESDLAVAGSTIAVAALFRPLRARVQGFIDQRFYRRRYDAAATLSRFSARLRDEIELRALSSELIDVVGETMQPAHASLWLRTRRQA